MTKAIFNNGVFSPLGPVPADWLEGAEVRVELANSQPETGDVDEWKEAMDQAAAEIDPEDASIFNEAIDENRRSEKEQNARLSSGDLDNWSDEVARAAANISDEDEEILAAAIRHIRAQSRALAAKGKL